MVGAGDRRVSIAIYRAVSVSFRYLDAALRLVDSLPWFRLPGHLLKPAVGLVVWLFAVAVVGGRLLDWVETAVVLFVFTPFVYRATLGLAATGYGFRLLVAAFGLAYADLLSHPTTSTGVVRSLLGLAVASGACLMGYLHSFRGWRLLAVDGRATDLLERFRPAAEVRAQFRRDRTAGGWWRGIADAVHLGALGTVLGFPCFLVGLSATFLVVVSPLADLALLGWLVYEAVGFPDRDRFDLFDFESRVFRATANATRNVEGMALAMFAAVGLALSAVPLTEAAVGGWLLVTSMGSTPVLLWNLVGAIVAFASVGVYLAWVWLRMLDRLSGHLDCWDGVPTVFGGPNRPVAVTLPAVAAYLGLSASFGTAGLDGPAWPAVTIAWSLSLAVLVGCAWLTDRRSMRFPERDDLAAAVGLSAQVTGFWLAGVPERVPPNAGPGDWIATVVGLELAFAVVVLPMLAFLPDAVRYASKHGGLRWYVGPAYLAGLGVSCSAIALLGRGEVAGLLGLLGGFCLLSSVVLAATRRFEPR